MKSTKVQSELRIIQRKEPFFIGATGFTVPLFMINFTNEIEQTGKWNTFGIQEHDVISKSGLYIAIVCLRLSCQDF